MRKTLTMLATAGILASSVAVAGPASAEGPACRQYVHPNNDTADFMCSGGSEFRGYTAFASCPEGLRESRLLPMGQWGTMQCRGIRIVHFRTHY